LSRVANSGIRRPKFAVRFSISAALGDARKVFVSPANKNLRDALVRLNLCSDRDFRRCRPIVRKLARGIPAFDFVWIDALVQLGSLTAYQAKVLQSAPPDQLCIGRCVLLERLGSGNDSKTYRARGPQGESVVLKRLPVGSDESAAVATALGDCIERTRGLESPFVVSPHSLAHQAGALVVISRYVAGPSCKELIVRRGRFPSEVVAEIARQVAHGCAALEARALLHGQIRLDNVRMTNAGNAVLVDAGIGGALAQSVLIRDDVPPEVYDAIAPERIGTGNPLTTASEIYAFGCLLWQLLAGRPPFPTGDPLAKLAAHQSRGVPDVRTIAPDVPAPLADAVRACTQRNPHERPATFAAIARRFSTPNPSGRQRLSRFLRRFDGAAPADQLTLERPTRFPTATVALLLFVLSGAALFLLRHGATAELLRVGNGAALTKPDASGQSPAGAGAPAPSRAGDHLAGIGTPTQSNRSPEERQENSPLPPPNADGVIELSGSSYDAEVLHCVGDLIIRGTGGEPATILVGDRPFRAGCRKFAMEHVIVRQALEAPIGALMEIRSQELAITGCTFLAPRRAAENSTHPPAANESFDVSNAPRHSECIIAWTAAPARDPDAGRIRLTDVVFSTGRTALRFETAPRRVELDNCLKLGGGLLEFGSWSTDREITVFTEHLTLRRSAWLCRMSQRPARSAGLLRLVLKDSAFDLAGPASTLIDLMSSAEPPAGARPITVTGRDSVIRPNVPIVAWSKPGAKQVMPVDFRGLVVEGLTAGDFQFVGPIGASPAASAIDRQSLAIPRQSDEPPGIIVSRLTSALGLAQIAR
jgi:eukaryotic-like serine/threonine-protein kinase